MSKKKTYEEFLEQAIKRHGNKYVYHQDSYKTTHDKMKITCPKHGDFYQTPKAHLLYGCNKCAIEMRAKMNKMTTNGFVRKAIAIHDDKYDYSKVNYTGIREPVEIICKKHGPFYQIPMNHLAGKGCPLCNESHLERILKNELNKNDIKYKTQYPFLQYRIDFYIPNKTIAIECQGKQHVGLGGWSNHFNFEEQLNRDLEKKKLLEETGIKVIYLIDDIYYNIAIEKYNSLYNKENLYKIKDINNLINFLKYVCSK